MARSAAVGRLLLQSRLPQGGSKGVWSLNRIDGFDLVSKDGAVRLFGHWPPHYMVGLATAMACVPQCGG
jgi:hypothetical protein